MEAFALAAVLFAFGDLPAAAGWTTEAVLGPAPYVFVPLGAVGVSFGGVTMPSFRLQVLPGPTVLWVDLPPPVLRIGVGRSVGPILLAGIVEPWRATLAWEIPVTGGFSIFGALGGECFLGARVGTGRVWGGAMIREGELSLWSGFYF